MSNVFVLHVLKGIFVLYLHPAAQEFFIAVHNYSAIGDEILISDWHWGHIDSVIQDNLRKFRTFSLINEEGHFDSVDFKKQVEYLVSKQQNTVILFNGIANNPTDFV